jgi:hypothetical protein
MAAVRVGQEIEIENVGGRAAVPAQAVAHVMYYLNCVASVTTVTFPPRLIDYQHPEGLSKDELTKLRDIALICQPEVLEGRGFRLDKDGVICRTSWNEFFDRTDQEFASITPPEMEFFGAHVMITRIMFYKPEWRFFTYDISLAALILIVEGNQDPKPAPPAVERNDRKKKEDSCWLEILKILWRGPISQSRVKRISWYFMLAIFILLVAVIVRYSLFFSWGWIDIDRTSLNFIIATAVLAAIHTLWAYITLCLGKLTGACGYV